MLLRKNRKGSEERSRVLFLYVGKIHETIFQVNEKLDLTSLLFSFSPKMSIGFPINS